MADNDLKEKFIGCLVGAAIGDALGMPNEDVPARKSEKYYPGGITDFTDPHPETACGMLKGGQYTDDTQLMMALAQALVEKREFDPDCFVKKLIVWYRVEANAKRYQGEATKGSIKNLISGKGWQESGIDKAGCGGSTRAVPSGLFFFGDSAKICKCSSMQCHVTHNNQIAKDGAVCVAATIASLLGGKIPPVGSLRKLVKTREFKGKLGEVDHALKRKTELERAIQILGNSSLATEVVGLSLFILLSKPSDFEKAVLLAANATGEGGGDTDSIAFLVGAFSGAYNGIGKIRRDWIEKVESSEQLWSMGAKIYQIVRGEELS